MGYFSEDPLDVPSFSFIGWRHDLVERNCYKVQKALGVEHWLYYYKNTLLHKK